MIFKCNYSNFNRPLGDIFWHIFVTSLRRKLWGEVEFFNRTPYILPQIWFLRITARYWQLSFELWEDDNKNISIATQIQLTVFLDRLHSGKFKGTLSKIDTQLYVEF